MFDYEMIDPPASQDRHRSVLRSTVLLTLAFLVVAPGAYIARMAPDVGYTAEGKVWIEGASRHGSAWAELLRSYRVLEPVVVDHRLYLRSPEEHASAFASFVVAEQFLPGAYRLRVGVTGEDFVLINGEGSVVQQGPLGTPVGQSVGFVWTPIRGSFAQGATVEFSVLSVRDAARDLSAGLMITMDRDGEFLTLRLIGADPQATVDVLNSLMEQYVSVAAELKSSRLNEVAAALEERLQILEGELERAEEELEEFRLAVTSLRLDRSTPIQVGLELTRDPVFGAFFQNRIELEQLRRDRSRLETELMGFGDGSVRIEALEVVPAVAASRELRRILDVLADARSQLRALRDVYADDYPPIQNLLVQVRTIETQAVPRVVQGIIDELSTRENELQGYLDEAAAELGEIPPRTIEEGRLRRRVDATEALYLDLRGRVETARLAAATSTPDLRILDRASVMR